MKLTIQISMLYAVVATCMFILFGNQKSAAQCTSARPGMTINGVTITGDGNIGFGGEGETACGFTTPPQSLYLSEFVELGGGITNLYFSKPVNNLKFIIAGRDFSKFDYWNVRFTTNEGLPYLKTVDSCLLSVGKDRDNYIRISSFHRGEQTLGGGGYIISADRAFTNLVIRPTGGATPTFAICAESVIPCPDIPTLSTITQPTCENPTGSFRIANFDSNNTYTVSPSANTSISSDGVVTVPLNASYTVTAGNATCTSNPSAAAVVNNLICAQADAYIVEVNQTLTENLRANDGYIPPGETFYIPQPDPAFTNPSTCVPLVVNETSPEQKTLTFTCGTAGVYHFLVPVSAGGSTIRVPLTITVNSSLPVTLVSFNAKQEGKLVNLEWGTTEETNSDRFEIEWKRSGEWKKIGSVAAATESNELRSYTFQHSEPAAGQNLYRLKMIDREVNGGDKIFAYSAIRNVDFESLETNAVYPNPVTNGKLSLTDWTNVKSVEVYNQQGTKLKTFYAADKEEMDVSFLQNGLYVIKRVGQNGKSTSSSIVISK